MIKKPIDEIQSQTNNYLRACYLVWLERPNLPLDLPPREQGEEVVIGAHIRKIKKQKSWFKKHDLPLPTFDPSEM